jgi:hypothetical protein
MEMTDMSVTLNPAHKPTDVNGGAMRDVNSKKSPFGVFRTLFESGTSSNSGGEAFALQLHQVKL